MGIGGSTTHSRHDERGGAWTEGVVTTPGIPSGERPECGHGLCQRSSTRGPWLEMRLWRTPLVIQSGYSYNKLQSLVRELVCSMGRSDEKIQIFGGPDGCMACMEGEDGLDVLPRKLERGDFLKVPVDNHK